MTAPLVAPQGRIVITGSDGFIARNLRWRLKELGCTDVLGLSRQTPASDLPAMLQDAGTVFHLAGVNRPKDPADFDTGNSGWTAELCRVLAERAPKAMVLFASSTQAALDNPYGRSKRAAEQVLEQHALATGAAVRLFRLTNVFGKWSRPFYNSAVATFCHQVARGEAPTIHDPNSPLRLVYVDDVVEALIRAAVDRTPGARHVDAGPVYDTTVGEVATTLQGFVKAREDLVIGPVGTGLTRALYATFVSFLPKPAFDYALKRNEDPRGVFVEMLRTPAHGQFSYFTAHPGVTRGGHYHHTKTEKFLVIQGTARYGFRHIETGDTHELVVRGEDARVVETIPGWTHDITNIGDDTLVVMLWANELFDKARPDTVAMKVQETA